MGSATREEMQRKGEIQDSLSDLRRQELQSQIALRVAQGRLTTMEVALKEIQGAQMSGGSRAAFDGMKEGQIKRVTGLDTTTAAAKLITSNVIRQLNENDLTGTDAAIDNDDGLLIATHAKRTLDRYLQLGQTSNIPILPPSSLQGVVEKLIIANYTDGTDVDKDKMPSDEYWGPIRSYLARRTANSASGYNYADLAVVINNAKAEGKTVPIDLEFEYLLRSGQAGQQ
jgi:hypothetical protein